MCLGRGNAVGRIVNNAASVLGNVSRGADRTTPYGQISVHGKNAGAVGSVPKIDVSMVSKRHRTTNEETYCLSR